MVTELALKLNVGVQLAKNPYRRVALTGKTLLKVQKIAMGTISTLYLGFVAFYIYRCSQPGHHELDDARAIGISFMVAFSLMAVANLYLWV